MDQRLNQLTLWINQQLESRLRYQGPSQSLTVVSGDASFRRYFRCHFEGVEGKSSVICVDAPPDKEDNPQFVKIAQRYWDAGVPVPQVLAADFEQGFMMLTDLGDTLLKHVLNADNVEPLFAEAQNQLLNIMKADFSGQPLPLYDSALLQREMALFPDWYCERFLEMTLNSEDRQILDELFGYLEQQALQQAQVPVHRDYHTRNLMVLSDGTLGVIDFQDAVMGPVTYDLLSLLRDETFPSWPKTQVKQWVTGFAQRLRASNLTQASDQQIWQDFNAMGAQQHIKVAGIFARLHYRDHKQGYLEQTPQSLRYIMEECAALDNPAAQRFVDWLKERIVPKVIERLPGAEKALEAVS